jgi:hypothetical protein
MAAVGAMGLQAQDMTDTAPSKPWNVGANLRGFYDDNYNTAPANTPPNYPITKRSSWGADVNPSVGLNIVQDLTTIRLNYDFDMRYYADRVNNEEDYSHNFTGSLSHSFSERYKLDAFDSFVVGQEPALLSPGGTPSSGTYMRLNGNNMRNYAGISLTSSFTDQLGSRIGYQNTFYDYDQTGNASYAALLNRMEQLMNADLRWQYTAATTALIGYQFGYTDQTDKTDALDYAGTVPTNVRDRYDHYGFLGVDHDFNAQFSTQVRAGFEYAEYPNAVAGMDNNRTVPYADAMLQYKFGERNSIQVGVKNDLEQTDVGVFNGSVATSDTQSLTLYGILTYRLTPRLIGTVRGDWQMATFDGGFYNNQQDNYYSADVDLTYEINRHLSAQVGYALDRLDSDITFYYSAAYPNIARSFTRNRVYFGVNASY